MKKIFCVLFAVLLMISAVPMAVSAAGGDGMTFSENDKYSVAKSFEVVPVSIEAWVRLPKDAGRAGVVLGNYAGSAACVNFEITTNGRPRMYVIEYTSGEKAIHDLTFKSVDVRTGEYVHFAITHDAAKSETYCYVDGVLKETLAGALNVTGEVLKSAFAFGGDLRSGNTQYFKGAIDTVAVYSDARSAEEIKASMKNVDTSDKNLIAYYETESLSNYTIKDKSGNGYDVRQIVKWLDGKEQVTDYAYSFCVVGDTQVVTKNHPEKLAEIYDWIIENKDEKKIKFVFGMGDITDKSTDEEWIVAKEQIFKLNGVVPYSLVRGNHDGTSKYNEYFGNSAYTSQFEGFYEQSKIENSWRTFKVGNNDFLLITLDYGASDTILNWAAGVIESHPNHKVIITTHCYLYRDGTTLDADDVCPPNTSGSNDGARNNGDQMWDKLVSKYENIFLVLSGHDPCSDVVATQTKGVHGNTVTQMLVDPQGVDSVEGPTGMIAMLYFSNDGKTLTVEQYSTVEDKYYMSTSQFTLTLPEGVQGADEEDVAPETVAPETDAPETNAPDTNAPETNVPETDKKPDIGADIGIIGGADGPTAIFVAGQILPMIIGCSVAMFAIGAVVGFVVGRRRKRDK